LRAGDRRAWTLPETARRGRSRSWTQPRRDGESPSGRFFGIIAAMSDREAFLNAIAANPADDTARLAFADWLDEHDDPVRAEFIRVQIELGYADRKEPQHADLAAREKELLDAHRAQWLGPLETVEAAGDYEAFEPTFRRGFVESASIHGRALI